MPNPNRDLYDDSSERTRDPGASADALGVPDYADDLEETNVPSNPEQRALPGEEPVAVNSFGTTEEEELEGEGLERKLAREEPDFGEPGVRDEPIDDRPAEESAMRVEEL